jgi:pyruvate-formate lyase
MADVADSLSAIQRVVFEEKTASFAELLRAIQDDFQGHNPLHVRLMNPEKTPRYGNDDSAADANAAWLLDALNRAFAEKVSYRGGRYNVGFWTMTNHAGFGRLMKAFPSGRRAGESFASGITPVSGVTPTLVKALHSVAKLRPERLSNGIALNLKYTLDDGDPGARLDRFAATVEGYFDDSGGSSGGMEIQFNVTSHDTFADAVAHPENYPDLLVRVSGYTAYFKDLTPQMQKEIIDRTEYRLSSGQAVIYAPFPLPR